MEGEARLKSCGIFFNENWPVCDTKDDDESSDRVWLQQFSYVLCILPDVYIYIYIYIYIYD